MPLNKEYIQEYKNLVGLNTSFTHSMSVTVQYLKVGLVGFYTVSTIVDYLKRILQPLN